MQLSYSVITAKRGTTAIEVTSNSDSEEPIRFSRGKRWFLGEWTVYSMGERAKNKKFSVVRT